MAKRDCFQTGEPWGDAFVREAELVVAANVLMALRERTTVYNAQMEERLACFCRPLDKGYREDFLGVVSVPPMPAAPYRRLDAALSELNVRPRGAWSVLEADGRFQAYMSTGTGDNVTSAAQPFSKDAPDGPGMTFEAVYAASYASLAYDLRRRIEREVLEHSAASSPVRPGTAVKDAYLQGKRWNRITALGVEADGRYRLEAVRRGVKAVTFLADPVAMVHLFSLPIALPERYADPGGPDRTRSLSERRTDAAVRLWTRLLDADDTEGLRPGRISPSVVGNAAVARLVVDDGDRFRVAGEFRVSFAEGTDAVTAHEVVSHDAPAMAI